MTQAQLDTVLGSTYTDGISELTQIQAVLTGPVIEGDIGRIDYAFTTEMASESYEDNKDQLLINKGFLSTSGTHGSGSRDRYATAGELQFAVQDWLQTNLALRYDKYADDTNVDDAFTPQLGIKLTPTDSFLFAVSLGKSFRAPDMHMVYAGISEGFGRETYIFDNDPKWGSLRGQERFFEFGSVRRGSTELEEEKGDFLTLTALWEPTDDFSVKVDYFDIKLEGAVTHISEAKIFELGQNYTDQYSSCDNVPGAGYIFEPGENGGTNLKCIMRASVNSSIRTSKGYDVEIKYTLADLGSAGSLNFRASSSYMLERTSQTFADSFKYDWGSNAENNPEAKLRANASINWDIGDLDTTLSWHYIGTTNGQIKENNNTLAEITEAGWKNSTASLNDNGIQKTNDDGELLFDAVDPFKLEAFIRFNINIGYKITEDLKLSAGIRNLLDEMPPNFPEKHHKHDRHPFFVNNGSYNIDGRSFYASINYNF